MQDVLNLDTDARMNTPSTVGGNWAWRYRPEALNEWVIGRLRELVELYGRQPELWEKKAEEEAKAEAEGDITRDA
jgi:4-alpha-glucanotransferase